MLQSYAKIYDSLVGVAILALAFLLGYLLATLGLVIVKFVLAVLAVMAIFMISVITPLLLVGLIVRVFIRRKDL